MLRPFEHPTRYILSPSGIGPMTSGSRRVAIYNITYSKPLSNHGPFAEFAAGLPPWCELLYDEPAELFDLSGTLCCVLDDRQRDTASQIS